jgi:hypothetical protein
LLARAFGLSLHFETRPPGAWGESEVAEADLRVRLVDWETAAAAWSGCGEAGWEALIDGARFRVERGQGGDHRFLHGERSLHHLSADRRTLLCALEDRAGPVAWRVLLDSVLFSVALLEGYEALHAGAVVLGEGAIAIVAGSGGGKSTLLAALLAAGGVLLSDDVVALGNGASPPLAHPGPPLMTVPSRLQAPPGEALAALGEESWRAVPVAPEAVPLGTIVILDRRPGVETGIDREPNPLVPLLSSLLRFPRTPERERGRFELASTLASQVPIWRLSANPEVRPDRLADLIRLTVTP